jgi:hypothetical protein
MRRRELIRRLQSDHNELRAASGGFFPGGQRRAQEMSARRLELLHALENLLPEIIEKMEPQP